MPVLTVPAVRSSSPAAPAEPLRGAGTGDRLPIAFLATYPPRRCGIATFAADLRAAVGGGRVAVVRRPEDSRAYPAEVTWQIARDRVSDYRVVAAAISRSGVRAVSIQHEYGIFGGDDGSHVLDFLEALEIPAVATLHTVLRRPSAGQRTVLEAILRRTAVTAVMSSAAANLLHEQYGADPSRIAVIHHGVPDLPLVDPNRGKARLGLAGRTVILSFGLIGPGKGYEHMIGALDELRRTTPDVLFVILGATHPDLLRVDGERYRDRLKAQVAALGVQDHVRFEDRYVDIAELGRWLQAADIYVTPYPNVEQIASGTLSYAVGAGKAVVSTPYPHARELLAAGRGVLVEPASARALADGIAPLLQQPELRREIGRAAWAYGRQMVWTNVGAEYRALLGAVTRAGAAERHGRLTRPSSLAAVTSLAQRPVTAHG